MRSRKRYRNPLPAPSGGVFAGLSAITRGALHRARIATLADLEAACADGRIEPASGTSWIDGLGEKGVRAVLELRACRPLETVRA